MARYSLINVHRRNDDGTVDGSWMQDVHGSLLDAMRRADGTEAANSRRITVAVTEPVTCPVAILKLWYGMKVFY